MWAIDDYIPTLPWSSWGVHALSADVADEKILVPLVEKAMAKMCLSPNNANWKKPTHLMNGKASNFFLGQSKSGPSSANTGVEDELALKFEVRILHKVEIRHGNDCVGASHRLL